MLRSAWGGLSLMETSRQINGSAQVHDYSPDPFYETNAFVRAGNHNFHYGEL